jgi:inward rectifier potassium channel
MANRPHFRQPKPVPIGKAEFNLWRLGVRRFDLRDPYHLAVSLSWPGFILLMLGVWFTINLFFGVLYVLSPGDVSNAAPGSFADAFFFSIETLATVGYGVMAPVTLYGHILSAAEIVTGTAFTAIVTGLLFVRFSRPKARILYADDAVITTRNGKPALMLRIASGRQSLMTGANARLFALLEDNAEGGFFRRVHDLRLVQPHLPVFAMPWTLVHVIDESSPLFDHTAETLAATTARIFVTIEARDQALAAVVQDMKVYLPEHLRFGMHFADSVMRDDSGTLTADLTRISLLEPDAAL